MGCKCSRANEEQTHENKNNLSGFEKYITDGYYRWIK